MISHINGLLTGKSSLQQDPLDTRATFSQLAILRTEDSTISEKCSSCRYVKGLISKGRCIKVQTLSFDNI
jgi:hypothetical protein